MCLPPANCRAEKTNSSFDTYVHTYYIYYICICIWISICLYEEDDSSTAVQLMRITFII